MGFGAECATSYVFCSRDPERRGRTWAALIALAIIGILVAAVVWLSFRSPKPFDPDDLYGVLGWAVKRAERSRDYKVIGHRMAREYC